MKVKSFESMREVLNLEPLDPKNEKQLTCRKCGAVLRKTGDNVYVCDGFAKDKDKDGSNKRCGCFYIKYSFK